LIYPGEDQIDVPGAEGVVEKAFVQHHADLQLGGPLLPLVVVAQEGDCPLVPADQVQNTFDGSGLACPILANEAHDGPSGNGQVDIPQRKIAIGLAEPLHFNTICHNSSNFLKKFLFCCTEQVCRG